VRSRRPARPRLVRLLSVLLCCALLLSPSVSALQGRNDARQNGSQAERGSQPTKGAPGQNLPNLDDVKRRGPSHAQAQPPVPSKLRKYRHEGPGRGDSGGARDSRAGNSTSVEPTRVDVGATAAASRAYSLLGALAASTYNPYADVTLASAIYGIPEPPSRDASQRTLSPQTPSSNTSPSKSWLSSLASIFGFGAAIRRMPQGYFDSASCTTVSGWAWDSAQPNTPIIVTLFDGSQPVASILADQYRADLVAAGIGDGRHGFSMPLPDSLRDGATHTLSVQVQGTGFTLGSSPKTISSCTVAYDGAISSADCDQITGWAWDSQRPTTPIDVDIYVDGVFRARESADTYDATLNKGDNRHRFRLPTPVAARDGQAHSITVRPAGSTQTLGSAVSVTCNGPSYQGFLDYADCNVIDGWIVDWGSPNTPVSVDIYSGSTFVTRVLADNYRQDIANLSTPSNNGRHGFYVPVPDSLRDGVSHQLSAVATGSSYALTIIPGPITCSAQSSCGASQTLASTEFVKDFYLGALARQPRPLELQYWNEVLRTASAQGQTALLAEAKLLGRELFREGEYANINATRPTSGKEEAYVADLYWSYLQRGPDASGQSFWANNIRQTPQGQDGWLNALSAFESSSEFSTRVASICPSPADSVRNYDAVTDFSPLQNSDGAWSYGYRPSGGSFTPYASYNNMFGAGLDTWSQSAAACCPMVTRNNTGSTSSYAGNVVQTTDELNLHPGPNGERGVVRWTAPTAGTYNFQGRFQGISVNGTTSDVSVTHNGSSVFGASINGFYSNGAPSSALAPFSLTRSVNAGDTVEFSVGFGSNANYNNDSTGLAVTVSQPTPAQTQPYNGAAGQVPGKIEAELYDAGGDGVAYHDFSPGTHGQDYDNPPNYPPPTFRQPTDVDIYKSAAGYSNGYLVVMQAGDWMNYTVDVAQAGSYTLSAQTYYWGTPGGSFHIEADGVNATGSIQLPGGSSWQTVVKTGIQLNAGRHVLKVVCDANGSDGYYMGDLDYMMFTADADSGLVANWKFDEGTGTSASDSTGNGSTGTLQSGASWSSGVVGSGALNFNGTSGSVSVASTTALTSVSNNFTISFWANPRSTHEIDPEGTTGVAGVGGQRYAFGPSNTGNSGEAGAGVSVGTNGVSVYEHGPGYMPATLVYQNALSGWTHVAVVYQNRQPSLYVNGQLVRTGVQSPMATVRAYPWNLGGNSYGYFDGQVDDVRVYNRVLSAGEVGALAGAGGADPTGNNFSEARKDPANETGAGGDDPLSRNFNFSVPLAGLKGRAGLDAGLSLSYNSLVWTRDAATGVVKFDADDGDPSPGFRLGMPVIQRKYRNARGENAYMMITSSGGHVEFRQVGTTNTYEAIDSSYAQLTEDSGLTLRPADGSRLSYSLQGLEYKCTKVEDRNGNFITLTYNSAGDLYQITDTLGRVITVAYDANGRPIDVEQNRSGQVHQWATFGYSNLTISAGFASSVSRLGPANGTVLSVLTQVSLDDGSRYNFLYNSWGQVYRTEHHAADGRLLTYTEYDLQSPISSQTNNGTDCPRFTQRKDFAKDWNGDAPVVITYSVGTAGEQDIKNNQALSGAVGVDTPATVLQKIFYGAANTFKRGLVTSVETWAQSAPNQYTLVRTAQTTWTQDDETLSYQLNPRVSVSEVFDPQNNHTGTTVAYTSFGLSTDAYEWSGTSSNVLRRSHTEYDLDPVYVSRRVIGLVSSESLYDGQGHVASMVSYEYDQGGEFLQSQGEPVQHDGAGYGATFVMGRGLVTSIRRWDVTALQDATKSVESRVGYNTTGAAIFSRDPLGHQSTISYSDRFSDKTGTNTLAYPTMATDADGFSSKVEYGFDTGLVGRTEDPKGAQQTFTYDAAGRTLRVERSGKDATTNQAVPGGYVRWVYSDAMDAVQSWTQVDTGKPEVCSISIVDGAGRTRATATDFPNSTGGYSAQQTNYDIAGRVSATTNPAEINGLWTPTSEDSAGWNWTTQTYDWKGRPLVTTEPKLNPNDLNEQPTTKELSYGGCGCAGGEVVTIVGELVQTNAPAPDPAQARRTQKVYHDPLGRVVKTETYRWDGTTIYSTAMSAYDALDHVTQVTEQVGVNGTSQVTTMGYDGHGRLKTRHAPDQQADPNNAASTDHTTWDYNVDDTMNTVKDARGAVTTYGYNNRRLVTSVSSALSGLNTVSASYTYDAVGNRTGMSYGTDWASYDYDALSRIKTEKRYFRALDPSPTPDPNRAYALNYSYTLTGQLKTLSDPFGSQFTYTRDAAGRLTDVTGTPYASITSYVSNARYRAWGSVKSAAFGDGDSQTTTYDSRMRPYQYRLTNGSFNVQQLNYSYYADSRMQTITDPDDGPGNAPPTTLHFFSRGYTYDFKGRVLHGGSTATNSPSPFVQNYAYDEFDNMTSRSGTIGYNTTSLTDAATYTSGRRNGWTYDVDGRLTLSPQNSASNQRTWSYDVAGRLVSTTETSTSGSVTLSDDYDGDGQSVREAQVGGSNPATYYLVRSSVLGGEVVTRLTAAGAKAFTYVPAEGVVFAQQSVISSNNQQVVGMVHRDAVGVSEPSVAYDPLGNYIAPTNPVGGPPPPSSGMYGPGYGGAGSSFGNAYNYSTGCMAASNNPADCNSVMQQRMNQDFWDNLPHEYTGGELLRGENNYVTSLNRTMYGRDTTGTSGVIWFPGEMGQTRARVGFAHFIAPGSQNNTGQTGTTGPQKTDPQQENLFKEDKFQQCLKDLFHVELVSRNWEFHTSGEKKFTTELRSTDPVGWWDWLFNSGENPSFTIETSFEQSGVNLGLRSGGGGNLTYGMTPRDDPHHNFVAPESFVHGKLFGESIAVYELGNALGLLTKYQPPIKDPGRYQGSVVKGDVGGALVDCVYGGAVTEQGQIKPPKN
jgi:YD repeat-containing protein